MKKVQGFSPFTDMFIITFIFTLPACGLTCTEHSEPGWKKSVTLAVWSQHTRHAIVLIQAESELIAYRCWWWGQEQRQGLKPGISHWHHNQPMAQWPLSGHVGVSSSLSRSRSLKFVLPSEDFVERTRLPSLPCDPPQKLSCCWVSLWDVVSKRLLRANQVWWHPLLRELRRRQLRKCVPSQVDLPGQRGGSEKAAQDWKRGRSHNCSGFSYTF